MRDELSKRILYLENGVGFGGAVISLRTYLDHADLDRFPAVLVHSLDDAKFGSFARGVKTIYLPEAVGWLGPVDPFVRKANLDVMQYALAVARVARAERVSCIYLNNDLVTNLAGMIAGRMLRLPVIQHERDIPAPISRLATALSSYAARVFAISGPVRQALLERIHYPRERIRMVPEGLDLSLYQLEPESTLRRVRSEFGVREGERMVVIVGMVMDWKGQHVLIDAAPGILEHHAATKFIVVGESPTGAESYAAGLRDQVARLGLSGRVVFSGYRGDIPAVMQAADVVVHASTSPEPFGRVLIEGMAMRKPVIATSIGAPLEIIREGETGYLVPPQNAKALATAVVRILDDPLEARRIGDNARREVVRNYSIQRHTMLIESVFEEIFWGAPPALAAAMVV